MADERSPFADVRPVPGGGFSIPDLKWRELIFIGALRADGDAFVRDPSRPLPPFQQGDLFPEGREFRVTREAGRVLVHPSQQGHQNTDRIPQFRPSLRDRTSGQG